MLYGHFGRMRWYQQSGIYSKHYSCSTIQPYNYYNSRAIHTAYSLQPAVNWLACQQ